MKVVFLKKKKLFLLLTVVAILSLILFNSTSLSLGKVYFASSIKKLPIYSVDTEENKIAISFDAAWGSDKTREIMSICDSYGVKATFFLVGFWVEANKDLVKEIYNNGFEIGLHSNTHPDMTKLSKKEMQEELTINQNLIKDIIGVTPTLFRPPFGYYNNDLIDVCEDMGIQCIQWSVDSHDWMGISAGSLSSRVVTRAKNGSIVLFHNNSENIIDGLKMVLEHFKLKNTDVVPIGELIYKDNYRIDSLGVQIKE